MPYSSELSDRNITNLKDSDAVLNQVIREIDESERVLSEWKNKLVKYYELYAMVQRKKNYNGLSQIFVPETLRAVETIVAKLYSMIFAQPDWFQFEGRDNNGDEGSAIALTQLTMYQMEENNFKSRIMDALRQMVIAGLVVRKVGWDYQEVKRKSASYKDGKRGVTTDVETIKDTWTLEPVDLLGFHISDINIPYNDLQKATWIGEQLVVSKNYVTERMRRGWLSRVQKWKLDEAEQTASSSKTTELQDLRLSAGGFSNIPKKDKVELIERWGLLPAEWVMSPEEMAADGYEEGDLVEGVIVIGNRVAILKLEVNPFWHNQKPYVACPYVPKENELPGMGAVQIGESLQEEINDTRNQTMDNKTLILSCMWLKTRASGIKNSELTIRANGVITTNDINGLQALRPPVVSGVGTNMEGIAKEDLRQSVGAASNLQGIAQAGIGTATESSIVNRESLGRILMNGQLFVELVIKPMFTMSQFLNYQFYDHVKVIKLIGPVGVKFQKPISPEEIGGGKKDVIIKVALDGSENPAVMRQQMMNFFTILQTMPPELISFHWKMLDKLYGMFFNGHQLSELYPNLAEIDPAELLTPEQERDMVLAEQPVLAKRGQDHMTYIQYHEREFGEMAFALSEIQMAIYKKLIMSHYQLLQMEAQEQQMMFQAQQAMQGNQGNMIDKGRTKNTTPHNQSGAPSTESMRKDIGG